MKISVSNNKQPTEVVREFLIKEAGVRSSLMRLAGGLRGGAAGAGRRAVGFARRRPVVTGLGAGALGVGASATGYKGMQRKQLGMGFGQKKKSVEWADRAKTRIRWNTYSPGGPILEGPKNTMKRLFRIGKSNKKEGLTLLARLMKQGTIRKVGTVP
jgi:hypothetical protein